MRVPPGSQLVFDQVVTSGSSGQEGSPVFSDPKFNDWLGRSEDLRLFVVVDRSPTFGGDVRITVQETADEERPWFCSLTGTTLSDAINFSGLVVPGTTTVLAGSDTNAMRGRPSVGFRRIKVTLFPEVPGSARVRVWATGRNGYRRFQRLLLSERLEGTDRVYGPHEACAWLAGVDGLAFAGFAEEISGLAPSLIFLVGESPNGRSWTELAPPVSIPFGTINLQVAGGINYGSPWSGFARFGLQLGGTNPAATVKLWVTGRDVRSG